MPATAPPTNGRAALTDKLKAHEQRIDRLLGERAELRRKADEARERFAAEPELTTDSAGFREADTAVKAVGDADDRLARLREEQTAVLRLLSSEPGVTTKAFGVGDLNAPGAWLAETSRRDKALTTDDIGSTEDLSRIFISRLSERSAILAAGPTVVDITTSSIKIPVLTGRMTPAVPVAELAEIPEGTPPMDVVDVEPVKFAKLVQLSTESWADARPPVLAAHERELVRSISEGFDAAVFHGAPTAPQPGLAGTSGIAAVNATGMEGVDAFVRAIGALRRSSATATALFVSPATWEALGLIKEADGSNKPLVAAERAATGAPAETLLGVPVFISSAILAGHGFAVDMAEVLVVRRTTVAVDVDPFFGFSRGAVGVRAIFRAKVIVGQPAGVAHITNLPS